MIIRKDSVAPTVSKGTYPAPYTLPAGRLMWQALGDAGGLTQYGVSLETLHPGAVSSQMHWEDREDEFLYMLAGELTVIEDGEEAIITQGDACAWKANTKVAHQLRNQSDADATYLIIGTRDPENTCHYPGLDMLATPAGYTHLDGTKYPQKGDDQ